MFLENSATIFLAFHLVTAIVTLIILIAAASYVCFASEKDWTTGVKASLYGAYAYVLTFIIGLLIYPVFRINVRAADFDKVRPWATGLFEIKEHVGSIALFAAIGIIFLAKATNPDADIRTKRLFSFLTFVVFAVFIMKFIFGILLGRLNRI